MTIRAIAAAFSRTFKKLVGEAPTVWRHRAISGQRQPVRTFRARFGETPHLARGVEFTREPVEQDYGTDVGLRDPFGNHIRIVQLKA
jgi:AraC-like DNA-binding protein